MNRSILHLIVLLVLVVGGGWIIGASNLPGAWYGSLIKPPFNPPNWLFPIAWTVLYILVAVAGWRTYERVESGAVMQVWWGQLLLNFAWSPVFFTAHLMWVALGIIVSMFVLIVTFIVLQWRADRIAALLFVPYACWVAFASVLNLSLNLLN
ncbi:tryptophan-rich sensory protein [Bradyrhizobium ontarionense]|uniref:Tryptophan-rich sensory protein n=1 Tax=Bradyrhizobium ontarionense TaxID=2898149 RepID=A0ABY3RKD2_9BRAD|nr:TspO/MBR family protein [Bradyrhizobium sp. A19]UFZ07094.1 tryptophan-rich sensory protein [Bradyrhizobium sp. A19]